MEKITTQYIANELNISRNTVSRSLHDKQGVSLKTRQIVKRKARELGYKIKENRSDNVNVFLKKENSAHSNSLYFRAP
ncbi:hypothetical protein Q757_03440 [Oenococcus alcoholitolerans]|uniref:HTH lacI-type domain-containing protein n=1 Tax=Oenococcus alcoholitolerans TaxID=931074 RepID=A0ABR4XRE0_9LACO|nr:hypothetical protein Q757_03440 [Oenococcus alcoholitolerans]